MYSCTPQSAVVLILTKQLESEGTQCSVGEPNVLGKDIVLTEKVGVKL